MPVVAMIWPLSGGVQQLGLLPGGRTSPPWATSYPYAGSYPYASNDGGSALVGGADDGTGPAPTRWAGPTATALATVADALVARYLSPVDPGT